MFSKEELEILRDCLSTGDIEDYSREQLEDKAWTEKQFEIFNLIREKLGLEVLDPY